MAMGEQSTMQEAKMFQNDAILSFQGNHPRKSKPKKMAAMGLPAHTKKDDFIMDTNNSSIVSKRSVEKLYYAGQPEYFRYFVKKFQRRSPLINRGYWLRMRAVDETVRKFLSENNGKQKVVVNLGCGYDPLPFEYLGKHRELCDDATFVDVDYPALMEKKHKMIVGNPPLHELMPDLQSQPAGNTILSRSEKYLAVGCDLRQLDKLEAVLRKEFNMDSSSVAILFTAEVSVAYMTLEASDAVLKWTTRFDDVRFCLLEQHLPDGRDHPFAQTMLKHFEKLRTPLYAIDTKDQMYNRFAAAGYPAPGINIKSLWELWADDEFLTAEQREALDNIEPFDEWEEFALFGSHYFLMVAEKSQRTMAAENDGSKSPQKPLEATTAQTKTFRCIPFKGDAAYRRFSAMLPSPESTSASDAVALHGGLGTRERLTSCDVYTDTEEAPEFSSPQLPTGIMCHTITSLSDTECLLVGGRASPDKASAACWYRKGNTWSKVHDLPEGRYRHNAVAVNSDNITGVIVFGGKNSKSQVLNDWLFWTSTNGWTKLTTSGPTLEPRFGAAMTLRYGVSSEGVLTGGLRQDGTIINDYWQFEVQHMEGYINIALQDLTEKMVQALGENSDRLGRFGASIVRSPQGLLLIGGVAADNMLTRQHEILELDSKSFFAIESENRPLLVGFSAMKFGKLGDMTSDILILGGGATCFSFGTYWTTNCVLRLEGTGNDETSWHLQVPKPDVSLSHRPALEAAKVDQNSQSSGEAMEPVTQKTIQTAAEFELLRNEGMPAIFKDLIVGACTSQWTNDYLKQKIGAERSVVVHACPSPHMNFQSKNFAYKTQSFGSLLDEANEGGHLYLRALSADKPSEKPTHLAEDFPSISSDFEIPEELKYVKENMHSSPLRVSGPVTMWLHYDVMANIYVQVRGTKRLLLFPPSEVTKLSFAPGASSSTLNPFVDAHGARGFEAVVSPGDILFIPPLWLHCAEPTSGLSVAVNVFFREGSMKAAYAAGRDVYGNRDLAAYERGRRDVQRIAKSFEGLSKDVEQFYLARLADELRDLSRV